MFGYVTANHMELKIKDYITYQACYCGLCQRLKKNHGQRARLVLSYDMTFVAILLNALYDVEETKRQIRCPFHPLRKRTVISSEMSDYASDMNVLLAYHNWEDDWKDDRSIKSFFAMRMLKKEYKKIIRAYPRQYQSVQDYMEKLAACEKKNDRSNIDEAANLTGTMFGEILVCKEDMWSGTLRKLGFALGKFIYYMDAFDDLQEDKANGSYNPLIDIPNEVIEEILKMLMAEVSECFEYLPIVDYAEILRNIIYSGVWMKYYKIKEERKEADGVV
jgi:hypothetical protein